jgi:hypothetical protein
MSKAHLIAPLLAKAADSSLTTAERTQASVYAKKLQDQYGKTETKSASLFPIDNNLDANSYYIISVLTYATVHKDYNALTNVLVSWGCQKTVNDEGYTIWLTKRPALATEVNNLMRAMATEQVAIIEVEKKAKAKELEAAEAVRTKRNAEQGYERVDTTDYSRNKLGGFVKATKDNPSKKKLITPIKACFMLIGILVIARLFV